MPIEPQQLVFRANEHVVDVCDDVGRHGKADTLGAHGLGVDGGVHADNLTSHVDQRATGVTGVDSGVGLDEALKLGLGDAVGAGSSMLRFLAEMMPAVTVFERANGLPMARTQSPTCAPSELPSLTVGSGSLVSILMTAMSVSLSTPITVAGRPSSPGRRPGRWRASRRSCRLCRRRGCW